MSDLDFEKQVRQKLNDLKLTPSAEAWVNIENKLRAHNNRRTPFLWLSLMLTGMLAGGFILLFRDAGQSIKKEAVATEAIAATQKALSGSAITKVPLAEDASIKRPSTLFIPEKGPSPTIVKGSPVKKAASSEDPLTPAASTKKLTAKGRAITIPSRTGLSLIKPKNSLRSNLWQGLENGEQETSSNKELVSPDNQLKESTRAASPVKSKPFVLDAKVFRALDADKDPSIASVAKPAFKEVRLNKWSFSGNGFAGISAVNEGGLINAGQPMQRQPVGETQLGQRIGLCGEAHGNQRCRQRHTPPHAEPMRHLPPPTPKPHNKVSLTGIDMLHYPKSRELS